MFTRRDFLSAMGGAAGVGALGAISGCTKFGGLFESTGPLTENMAQRQKVVQRHNVRVKSVDPAAVLSVGNGNFAFNVDCTGLQSLPAAYTKIPLTTLSHWGWHSLPRPANVDPAAFRYKLYDFHGRKVPYATDSAGQGPLFNYLRENPHRLNLGRLGLALDGKELAVGQISEIDQELNLGSGIVTSRFLLQGVMVEVVTCCHAKEDGIGVKISSPFCAAGRLGLLMVFPYGSTASSGDGGDWNAPGKHETVMVRDNGSAREVVLQRRLDETRYAVRARWSENMVGAVKELGGHRILLEGRGERLEFCVSFSDGIPAAFTFEEARWASDRGWWNYWSHGAAVDLGDCTDPRAPELERRMVLSQYMTAIHCAGSLPSQETGLLCNSWYGKFHLEMHWWHSVHFAQWGRQGLFEKSLGIYRKWLPAAKELAASQGFRGARWPKMVGPDGRDSPSSIGPLIIWQQPHPIYYAELCYRAAGKFGAAVLQSWFQVVVETAEFLASFAQMEMGRYVLGPAIRTVSENNDDAAINPTYELTAWRFGLATAQKWLERLGQRRNPQWDDVLAKLSPAPRRDGVYLMQEGQATFTKEWAWEHPALLGALGVLPGNGIDVGTMAATVRKVRETWDFGRVWGWDFPVAAMAAARTGQPELAIDFLMLDSPMNQYLPNGCNFQRDNVPAYFPGNGGLLAAIGMMAGGWDNGPKEDAPGFPKNGKWNVRAEGFRKWI